MAKKLKAFEELKVSWVSYPEPNMDVVHPEVSWKYQWFDQWDNPIEGGTTAYCPINGVRCDFTQTWENPMAAFERAAAIAKLRRE